MVAGVVSGLLGGGPATVHAAPGGPGDGTNSRGEDRTREDEAPQVWPRPQQITADRDAFAPLGAEVTLVTDEDADPYALRVVRETLRRAGARTVHESAPGERPAPRGTVVRVGTVAAGEALRALKVRERGDLPVGGYRLATGRVDGQDTVALSGVGGAGLFHAAQTLRQLVTERDGATGVPGVVIRDWPTARARGVTEGFYGEPWSHAERLEQLDFLGHTKQNRYVYAPGGDPFRQSARWRDPYPAAQRAAFRELARRAEENHVVLGWAVAPGQSLCFSSGEDRRALLRKLDAMRALGARAFQLQFDDVSYEEWHCEEDADTYGTGPEAAARAQAEVAGEVATHLAQRRKEGDRDLEPLSVLPTEFYQEGRTAYRTALARALDDSVQVAWTGVGVVPRTITGGELAGVRKAYPQQPVVTMDNYPVNDYAPERLFLGPYRGRQPAVASGSSALLANAMEQPVASRIPLFTVADFAWNPRDYTPGASWEAAVDTLAGEAPGARAAVRALAGNDASSMLGGKESAHLVPLLDALWEAHAADDRAGLKTAADRLREAFRTMRRATEQAPRPLARDAEPWLDQLALLGWAGDAAVRLLSAQARGDGAAAWEAQLEVQRLRGEAKAAQVVVGEGVLPAFLDRALKTAGDWTGVRAGGGAERKADGGPPGRRGASVAKAVDGDPGTAYRARTTPTTHLPPTLPEERSPSGSADAAGQALTVELDRPRPLTAVTVLTGPGSGTRAEVEVRVPGEGWRRIGRLSGSGWTQSDASRATADAVRLRWEDGTRAPVVHEITPWYADTPGTSLELSRQEVYAAAGGEGAQITARLTGHRPQDVRGELEVDAPDGFTVRAPDEVTVQRGGSTRVPLEVVAGKDVRPGVYRVGVAFGEQRRTLTVRAFPAAGGPDLARGAAAVSSGDETPDFPASAVTDGDPETRWSSPAEDDAWVRIELDRPARVGEVVLHWQEAYGARYRIEVSPDGLDWRTAASVSEGRGGRESVRMDAPEDTRFVRVRGEERGTRFGYSLWSVEAYAVRGDARDGEDARVTEDGRDAADAEGRPGGEDGGHD
ncbi:hyaluronidase [Streptomyces sp. RKND-216]|uniref:beta-N-acetylglucosaminidase domain-containing protein n=1 Tax=Streptomyces sp. RKND-216 TaxID=2562581 RepID=UPI00109E1E42|nr:beta-N-acetylglucosaminidase domain-containing protein [Streptomyces sp. RKND-216]THA27814.1 hyaluronidase [Streptomyces sp. RKND-216]